MNSSGGFGGGIYYANTGINQSTGMTITETMISNNSAVREGGGLRISSGSGLLTTVITDSSVSSNIAQDNSGGGICLVPGMLILQDQSDISYNTAGKYGGGISASEESLIQIEGGFHPC